METPRVLIFIVAYNAEATLNSVLNRIPNEVLQSEQYTTDILVIDDCSVDRTFTVGKEIAASFNKTKITVITNPKNLGYGGNQKIGYYYALKKGYNYVALIHGDGQYAPEELPKLLSPLLKGTADAVFGSRMLSKISALKGRMPLYKFIGNIILSTLQNLIVGTKLSEYHSGYRLYSCQALSNIPFGLNSDDFDFDTDIIIQLHLAKKKIVELPIPTFYGDEVCHVNGIPYAAKVILASVQSRAQRLGIFYNPKFDLENNGDRCESQCSFVSGHKYALDSIREGERVLVLGCNDCQLVERFLGRTSDVALAAPNVSYELRNKVSSFCEEDIDTIDLDRAFPKQHFDRVLALNSIERSRNPEELLTKIRNAECTSTSVALFTTPNVAFFVVRFMLTLGYFNYGKRGILDRTHRRLFTFGSLSNTLKQSGFNIIQVRGVPAPFPLALGRGSWVAKVLLSINTKLILFSKRLFAFQILIEASPKPTLELLLRQAENHSAQLAETLSTLSH